MAASQAVLPFEVSGRHRQARGYKLWYNLTKQLSGLQPGQKSAELIRFCVTSVGSDVVKMVSIPLFFFVNLFLTILGISCFFLSTHWK